MLLEALVFVVLAIIFYQDLKFRAVYWWLFLLLMAGLSILAIRQTSVNSTVHNFTFNAAFLAAQLLLLSAYCSVKERRLVNIFNGYFGLGDLLFLFSVTIYFSFLNYILYYVISLFLVILGTITNNLLINKHTNPKIPLAGYQALLLVVFMLADRFNDQINLLSDLWIVKFYS